MVEEGRLKQRLVGAVVLVALAVIFIPILLSGGRDMEMPVFGSNVPERSAEIRNIKHIDIKEMQETKSYQVNPKKMPIAKGLPEPEVVKPQSPSIIDSIKNASILKEDKKPLITDNVWAVQVGSFKNRTNALALQEKIRKKKLYAFVDRIMKKNTAIYRVRVGPQTSKEKAEKIKIKLKKEMNLSGLVVKHP